MNLTEKQINGVASVMVSACRESNNPAAGMEMWDQLRGMERILKELGIPYEIRYNAEKDRYIAVEVCGQWFSVWGEENYEFLLA